MIQDPIYILAGLCLLIALSEWLCKKTFLKHISTALLVIILTAIVANFGLLPSASNASPVYDSIFKYVAPASIFFLLLGVSLKQLKKAGLPMLIMFFVGAFGTILGVIVALQLIDGPAVFGDSFNAIAGMITGTYIGGSANFNAVALHYDVVRDGAIYTGVVVADNIVTAVWMMVTLSIPVILNKWKPRVKLMATDNTKVETHDDNEKMSPMTLALLIVMALGTLMFSDWVAKVLGGIGVEVPSILILTTVAIVLAQFPAVQRLGGAKLLGMFTVYMFLAVVGAFCEVTALAELGDLALSILLFTATIVIIHGLFIFVVGYFIKTDWYLMAIASQANIGGGSTALALAKSYNRQDLILPAILAGSLGTGVGTYFGFLVAGML
jgi:uncharacterized membrane protein